MCGIAGFNWEDEELARRMAEAVAHRGPDQDGTWVGNGASLGHRRLSILDLTRAGIQPMANDPGTLHIVYNGEVYNFREVREDLAARGHTFRSRTDTEVILKAYEEWGAECLSRLNGMFALAIHDARSGEFFLARDRLGIKPLYYTYQDGRFLFASEIKAILADPKVRRTPDPQSIFHYLGYEFVPAPRTMFDGIQKLPASHYMVVRRGEPPRITRYWDVAFDDGDGHDEDYYRKGLIARLDAAVERRLVADVPLGVFLSGGTDSSAVVAMMHRHVREPLKAFSIGYEDPSFSELIFARQVAQVFGCERHELIIDPISIPRIEAAVYFLDEPMTDLSTIPFQLICRKARERVTVCLSGEGGDESFVGYDRFKASKLDQVYRMLPGPLRRYLISPLVHALPDQRQKKGAINILKRFVQGSNLPADGGHMRWQYFLDPGLARTLFRPHVLEAVDEEFFEPIARCLSSFVGRDRLDREIYVDLRFTMPDSVLMKVDKMSMSIALEVRVPFLDHELVQFAAAIPGRYKLRGLTTKAVLRDALKGILPENIVWRKKQGYSFPIKNWLREDLRDYMTGLLNDSPVIRDNLEVDVINRLIREHVGRTHNHNHILWSLMNLAVWHKIFVLEEFAAGGARREACA